MTAHANWTPVKGRDKEFVAKEKADPDYVHASCAATVVLLQNAIERAGSTDKKKVRDALAKTDIQTFYGPIKFSANGIGNARSLTRIGIGRSDLDDDGV